MVFIDDQRDNGYSIDSQLKMIKEYCEKNEKDIKSKKIDKLVAIKVDRLTRNNYDGFWLLNKWH